MNEFAVIEKERECLYVFCCPAISGSDLTVTLEKESCTLSIKGESKDKEVNDVIDTKVSISVEVPKRYVSDKIKLSVKDGVGKVRLELSDDVIVAQAQ